MTHHPNLRSRSFFGRGALTAFIATLSAVTFITACGSQKSFQSISGSQSCKGARKVSSSEYNQSLTTEGSTQSEVTFASTAVSLGISATKRLTPASSWCSEINSASPGTQIIFAPGNYTEACTMTLNGTLNQPIELVAESELNKPVFLYSGSSANVFDLSQATYVTIRGLSFRGTQSAIDAIKIRGGDHITIEKSAFEDIGGISISANSRSTDSLIIRENTFKNLRATGMYFGCHDGTTCRSTNLLIERNHISGVTSSAVGYGFEVKLNSIATIQDNVVLNTKGPGIMVYGSNLTNPQVSVIQRNLAKGSVNDAGINVGGGPVRVINNIVFQNKLAGIFAQDYAGRGLQKDVVIVNNTSFGNTDSEIRVQNWTAGRGNVIAFNALVPRTAIPPFSPATPIGDLTRNVVCTSEAACLRSPLVGTLVDATPKLGGPLENVEPWTTYAARPYFTSDDFLSNLRSPRVDVGAFVGGAARPFDFSVMKPGTSVTPSPSPSTSPAPSGAPSLAPPSPGPGQTEPTGC